MRSPVTIISSFLIAFLGGLLLVPYLFDLSPWAELALDQTKNRDNVEIVSYENIEIRLLPSPSITFNRGTLQFKAKIPESVPEGPDFAISKDQLWEQKKFKMLRLNFSLIDLLFAEIMPHEIEISGLNVNSKPSDILKFMQGGSSQFENIGIRISESTMVIDVNDQDNKMVLEDVFVSVDIEDRLSPVELAAQFNYQNVPFTFSARSSRPTAARMPLILSLKAEPEIRLDFDGFVAPGRTMEVSGEFALDGSRLLAPLLHSIGFETTNVIDQRLSLSGLIFANATGIQTDNVRFTALGQDVAMQVNVDFAQDPDIETDRIFMRLTADQFDVSGLYFDGAFARLEQLPFGDALNLLFPKQPKLDAAIRIDNLMINNEVVTNIVSYIGFEDNGLRVNQVRADLPYGGSFFLSGNVAFEETAPVFEGSLAANSSDAQATAYWLFNTFDMGLERITNIMETSALQRIGFSANVRASKTLIDVTNLIGHIDGAEQLIALRYDHGADKAFSIKWTAEHMDVAKWGLLNAKLIPKGETSLFDIPLGDWLKEILQVAPNDIKFSVQFASDDFNVGSVRLGKLISDIKISDNQFTIQRLELSNFNGANLSVEGDMAHDNQYAFGDIDMSIDAPANSIFTRQLQRIASPLKFAFHESVQISTKWHLTSASDPQWPSMSLAGVVTNGDLDGTFSFFSPSRGFGFFSKDTQMRLRVDGPSPSVLALLTGAYGDAEAGKMTRDISGDIDDSASLERNSSLQKINPKAQSAGKRDGQLLLTLTAPNNQVASLTGEVRLAQDLIKISGLLRGVGNTKQIEGITTLDIANIGTYLGWDDTAPRLGLKGTSNTTLSPKQYAFSALDAGFGSGKVAGEGVYVFDPVRSTLTANLTFANMDIMPFFPHYEDGWSKAPVSWSLLELADANLELKLDNVTFNDLAISSAKGRLKLVDSVIEISDLQAGIAGGNITANVNAGGGRLLPSVTIDARLNGVKLAEVTRSILGTELLDASLSGSFNIRGRGRSSFEFMSSLVGAFNLDIGAGRLLFMDARKVNKPFSLLEGAVSTVTAEPPPALTDFEGETPFSNVLLLLAMRDGRLMVDQAEFLGLNLPALGLKGGVNVLTRNYDIEFTVPTRSEDVLQIQVGGPVIKPITTLTMSQNP